MFYLIHGANLVEQEEALAKLLAANREQDLIEANFDILEPPLTLDKLRQACDTIPFLGDKRIVIVRNGLGKGNENWVKEIASYLPDLPPTTLLIFVEHREVTIKHPICRAARGEIGKVLKFSVPAPHALAGWIRARAKKHGGAIDPAASALLAQNIGSNLHQLDQEIHKLILYHGEQGAVTVEDVQTMVPYIETADVIFDMVDALGQRRPQIAARHLHRLLEPNDKNALGIFGMIVRQYRLLIQARWLIDQGNSEQEIVQRLKLHPYVAQKITSQAQRFTLKQLRDAYHLLMQTDLAIKRGEINQGAALDLLVAQLTSI